MMRPDGLRRLQAVLATRQVKVQQAHVRTLFGDRLHAFLWRRHRRQNLVSPRLKGNSEGFDQNPLIIAEYKTHHRSRLSTARSTRIARVPPTRLRLYSMRPP